MRKITEIPKPPEVGDTRVVSMFTVLPISIRKDNVIETRWMERVHIKQQLTREYVGNGQSSTWEYSWRDIDFVDK